MKYYHTIYFLGIGGIGMSALARYFKANGKDILGYDRVSTYLTNELESEGMKIHYEDNISLIPEYISNSSNIENVLIIYTPAIPSNNLELNFFRSHNYTIKKRSEILGEITKNEYSIAIAGTHGKTTTSSIIAHILKFSGKDCTAFLGGISKNYNTNFLLPDSIMENVPVVVEADEFDKSFLTLYPNIAVITSMDADHLDVYGDKKHLEENYLAFSSHVKTSGKLFAKQGLELTNNSYSYSIWKEADFMAVNINIKEHHYFFDLNGKFGIIEELSLGLPGIHNVENALVAVAVGQYLGIENGIIKEAIKSYSGVKRRFDLRFNSNGVVYIDDYAHHPEELRVCIQSVKELYPNKKITGIFQPHLYSRTRDFVDGFAKSLSMLDELILMDIYPARELPIEGVNSSIIYDKVTIRNKRILSDKQIIKEIESKNYEVLLTMGAGDIDKLVDPIESILKYKSKLKKV